MATKAMILHTFGVQVGFIQHRSIGFWGFELHLWCFHVYESRSAVGFYRNHLLNRSDSVCDVGKMTSLRSGRMSSVRKSSEQPPHGVPASPRKPLGLMHGAIRENKKETELCMWLFPPGLEGKQPGVGMVYTTEQPLTPPRFCWKHIPSKPQALKPWTLTSVRLRFPQAFLKASTSVAGVDSSALSPRGA